MSRLRMATRTVSDGDEGIVDSFELPGDQDAFARLWTPHRLAYIKGGQDQFSKKEDDCPFCAAPERSDEDSLIVHRGTYCFVILNLYPYNPGHLMVCPYRHVPLYTDLAGEELTEFTALTQKAMHVLKASAKPNGFNLGMNQGEAGGAGVAAHLHQHLVPRWNGDANFLPIVAQTKAMAQTLGQMWSQLSQAWERDAQ